MGASLCRLTVLLALVGLLGGSREVRAEAPAPASLRVPGSTGDAAAKEATEHATRARQLFSEQKYSEAAEALQSAYACEAKPLYLFNAGTAYRKAELRKESRELYQRYLEVAPDGPLAAEARNYVKDLTALLASQERLQGATQLLEIERTQSQQKQEELEKELHKERRKPLYRRPWFVVTVTAMGIATVAAVGFGGYLESKKQQSQIIIQPAF
jgi:tetratricopeptide (TPR) repeat protein